MAPGYPYAYGGAGECREGHAHDGEGEANLWGVRKMYWIRGQRDNKARVY